MNGPFRNRRLPDSVTSVVSAVSGVQVPPPSRDTLTALSMMSGTMKKFGLPGSTPNGLYHANIVGKIPKLPKPLTSDTTGVPEPRTSVMRLMPRISWPSGVEPGLRTAVNTIGFEPGCATAESARTSSVNPYRGVQLPPLFVERSKMFALSPLTCVFWM